MANSTIKRLIRFRCKCGKKLKATHDIIGKKVKCTRCDKVHRVPETDRLDAKKNNRPKSSLNEAPHSVKAEPIADRPSLLSQPQEASPATDRPRKTKRPKITASIAKPPVVIESGTSDRSLMPRESDGSDARFKLDPLLAPAPVDDLAGPADNQPSFDFDLDSINIETTPTSLDAPVNSPDARPADQKNKQKKSFQKNTANSRSFLALLSEHRLRLIAGGAVAGMFTLAIVGYLVLRGNVSYPQEFSRRPEVQNYIATMQKFREKKIKFSLMSEAYIKANTLAESEVDEINAYKGQIEPLDNQDATLHTALEFFKSFQPEKARETLMTATQSLSDKIPELEAKAKDYSSKIR
jgi:hypothetical protein